MYEGSMCGSTSPLDGPWWEEELQEAPGKDGPETQEECGAHEPAHEHSRISFEV